MVNIPAYSQILSIKPSVLLNCYINHCNWLIYLCKLIDNFYYVCMYMYVCIHRIPNCNDNQFEAASHVHLFYNTTMIIILFRIY